MLRAVQPALSTRGEQRPCPPRTLARDLSRTLPGRPAHGVHPGPPEGSRAGGWAAASLAAAAGSGAGMASGKARWCGACVLHWNGAKPWVLANRSNGKLSASRADAQSEWLTAARLLDARLPECAALPSLGSVQAAGERNAASRDAHHEDLELSPRCSRETEMAHDGPFSEASL